MVEKNNNLQKPPQVPQHLWDSFENSPETRELMVRKYGAQDRINAAIRAGDLSGAITEMAGSVFGLNVDSDEEDVPVDIDGLSQKIDEYDKIKSTELRRIVDNTFHIMDSYEKLAEAHKKGNLQLPEKRNQLTLDKMAIFIGMNAYSLGVNYKQMAELVKTTYFPAEFGNELNERIETIVEFSQRAHKFLNESNRLLGHFHRQPEKVDKMGLDEKLKSKYEITYKSLHKELNEAAFLINDDNKILENIHLNRILVGIYNAVALAVNERVSKAFDCLKESHHGIESYVKSIEMTLETEEQKSIANSTIFPIAEFLDDTVGLINASIPSTPTEYTRFKTACSDILVRLSYLEKQGP